LVQDKSYAFERHVLVLNFTKRFMREEIVPKMAEQFLEEKNGIFAWAVEGLRTLLGNDRFVLKKSIQNDIDRLMVQVNPFRQFAEEMCLVDPRCSITTTQLLHAYQDWCAEVGYRLLGRNKFYEQVVEHFGSRVSRGTGGNGEHLFRGITLNRSEGHV
jgi:putative DNA primase/helicase